MTATKTKRVTVEEMRQHIAEVCRHHDVVVNYIRRGGYAVRQMEEIWIPAVKSTISYATALHELGHVLGGRYQRSRKVMVRERDAWRWARSNALIWTPAMERSANKSLAWYKAKHGENGEYLISRATPARPLTTGQ